jgi:hypothetical protein
MRTKCSSIFATVALSIMAIACSSDDDSTESSAGYTRDVVWDFRQELNTAGVSDAVYDMQFAMLSNGRLLISGNTGEEHHLLEVDWQNGATLHNAKVPGSIYIVEQRKDGNVVVIDDDYGVYEGGGIYNPESHEIDNLNNLPAEVARLDRLYTYTIGIDNINGPFLQRRNWKKEMVWTAYIDENPNDPYVPRPLLYYEGGENVWFIAAQGQEWPTQKWKLGKIQSNGDVAVYKQLTTEPGGPVGFGEDQAGNLFIANLPNKIRKVTADGTELWQKTVAPDRKGDLQYSMLVTQDGGAILGFNHNDMAGVTLYKYNAAGKVVWHEYYEDGPLRLHGFYELPNGDFIAVREGGLLVKYKVNK